MADMDKAEGVPPLEDMSELLQQVDSLRESQNTGVQGETKLQKHPAVEKSHSTKETIGKESKTTLCGFKKGFLLDQHKKSKKNSATSKASDIPEIKPIKDYKRDESLNMPEVQQALDESQAFLQNKEWLTNDLLQQVHANKELSSKLADPKFMQVITEFNSNPEAAVLKYQGDTEIQTCFKDFCGIMGNHFSQLGDSEQQTTGTIALPSSQGHGAEMSVHSTTDPKQATAEDEKKMETILSQPDVMSVLMKPEVTALLDELRHDPSQVERLLSTSDWSMRENIRTLIKAGLLQVEG